MEYGDGELCNSIFKQDYVRKSQLVFSIVATLDVAVVLTENVCCFTHDLVAQLVFEQHTVGISVVRDNRKHGQMNRKIR